MRDLIWRLRSDVKPTWHMQHVLYEDFEPETEKKRRLFVLPPILADACLTKF